MALPRPPRAPQLTFLLFLLLLLLLLSWPPPGDALALPGPPPARPAEALPDARALRRLQANGSRADRGPEPARRPPGRALTPEVRRGPRGRLLLRVPASPAQRLPEAHRLHRAPLPPPPPPPPPRPWDVTEPPRRALSLRGPRGRALRLRLAPPPDPAAAPPGGARLELHPRPAAGRGRRSAHARPRDACPLGPGRCCHLQTVQATLEDLGWSDWVLSPRQLQLSMCVGECPHLYRSASTHAQIKARLHGLQPDRVPAPCCVPSGYTPVVLLHRTDGGVALQTYDDLVARGCHCA